MTIVYTEGRLNAVGINADSRLPTFRRSAIKGGNDIELRRTMSPLAANQVMKTCRCFPPTYRFILRPSSSTILRCGDEGYARVTVENVAAAVARNYGKGRSQG